MLFHTLLPFEHGVTSSMGPDAPRTRTLGLSLHGCDESTLKFLPAYPHVYTHVVRGLSCMSCQLVTPENWAWEIGSIQRITM